MEYTPIQKLDLTLNMLSDGYKDIDHLRNNLPFWPPPEEFHRIINRLIKDEYVQPFGGGDYMLTFDGEYFQSQGGYIKKDENDIKLNIIAGQNEKRITANEKSLLRATWFAGISAALLLL